MNRRLQRRPLALCVLALSLTSCVSSGTGLTVQIRLRPDANDNSPVPLSLLLVYDPAVLEQLLAVGATQWFVGREQFLRDHAADVHEEFYELVPDQSLPEFRRYVPAHTAGGLVFVGYSAEGEHRYRFDPSRALQLEVRANHLCLTQPELQGECHEP
ncbi:hypothetical protein D7Y15_42235 [Corallococcus sp. AB030]|uniref:hypothetical protein n=1 Tax=Corallococcus sp. AB030 TaxID=2316716 RepID=UPI000ECE0769|nr:hypothetical protein [Corallococcus sp. AB030]RKH95149.1 hypothetical protein D7Y15_42235 [Corallococcus sp. AB030]